MIMNNKKRNVVQPTKQGNISFHDYLKHEPPNLTKSANAICSVYIYSSQQDNRHIRVKSRNIRQAGFFKQNFVADFYFDIFYRYIVARCREFSFLFLLPEVNCPVGADYTTFPITNATYCQGVFNDKTAMVESFIDEQCSFSAEFSWKGFLIPNHSRVLEQDTLIVKCDVMCNQ